MASMVAVALLAEGVDRNRSLSERCKAGALVALLAEGVDRNAALFFCPRLLRVALLAEGVDRNGNLMVVNPKVAGCPPRGGRG